MRFGEAIDCVKGPAAAQHRIGREYIEPQEIAAQFTDLAALHRIIRQPIVEEAMRVRERSAEERDLAGACGLDATHLGERCLARRDPAIDEGRMLDEEGRHAEACRIADTE